MPRKAIQQDGTDHAAVEASCGAGGQRAVGAAGLSRGRHQRTDVYRWRKENGGLKLDQPKRLKALEQENAKLKRMVDGLSLEKQILKGVAEENL